MVEVPELFDCGLLHVSEAPTRAGWIAFSRAPLANSSRLSSDERPGPRYPRNGMTWACAAADRITQTASAADKQRSDRSRIRLSSPSSASPAPVSPAAHQTASGGRPACARQAHRELGEGARLALDRDGAAMLLRDDVPADRETEPGAFAGRLGREERLEQFVATFWRHPPPLVPPLPLAF